MGTAIPRTKTKTARAKAVPRAPTPRTRAARQSAATALAAAPASSPASERRPTQSPDTLVDAIFADLPEGTFANGNGVPDVVRRNRRERARRRLIDALRSRGEHPIPEQRRQKARVLAERWAQKGFVDAFAEADEFELQCAAERDVLDAASRGNEEARFAAAERAHREEVVRRHGSIEIRGLQLSARVYQDLGVAYVPLHVEDREDKPPEPIGPPQRRKRHPAKTGAEFGANAEALMAVAPMMSQKRVLAVRALAQYPRLHLIGAPGSGKSTLLAYFASRAGAGRLHEETGWVLEPVPFLVAARSLQGTRVSVTGIARLAATETWFFEETLRRGRALVLIDGLDEAPPDAARDLLRCLMTLLEDHPGNRVLLSSRPVAGLGEQEPVPPGFASVRMTSMTREEIGTFVDRWCLAAELSLGKARDVAEAEARTAAEDLKERIRQRRAIEKLAETPLLCSVICIVHRFLGQRIPARRVALYEAITNVLLYEWDRAKFPDKPDAALGKLDAQAKRALLARLALTMHEARTAQAPAQKVIESLARQLPDLGHAADDAAAIVAQVRDRSGVLVERTPGWFAFSHLTFQEYLTALEIVRTRDYDGLLQRYQDKWWHEVIVLAAGFPGADVARLVRRLLDADGDTVAQGTMLAAQCAETAVELSVALRNEIDTKVATLVPPRTPEAFGTLLKLGEIASPVLLRRLETEDATGKTAILLAIGRLRHEPAVTAIIRGIQSDELGLRTIPLSETRMSEVFLPVAACAAFAAAALVVHPTPAFERLLEAMPRASATAVSALKTLEQLAEVPDWRARVSALIRRYEETHPTPGPSSVPSSPSKPVARSGSRPRRTRPRRS